MACPFFLPAQKLEIVLWPHPGRLPLGAGWSGACTAPGHEGACPTEDELKDGCNLGYARGCSRIPQERTCDAVRFHVAGDREGRLVLRYVCERKHLPVEHGTLEMDGARWVRTHPDARIQKMAECYVETYLERRKS